MSLPFRLNLLNFTLKRKWRRTLLAAHQLFQWW
jgi:hypothetical protein